MDLDSLTPQEHLALAHSLLAQSEWAKAEPHLKALYHFAPDQLAPKTLLARVYSELQRYDEAAAMLKEARPLLPALTPEYQAGLSHLLNKAGKFEEVLPLYAEAKSQNLLSPMMEYEYALALDYTGEVRASEAHYQKASEGEPGNKDYRRALGMVRMKLYNPAEVGKEFSYDDLFQRAHEFPFPRWRGESLAGKSLFIWKEQGIGDVMMFAGFLPHVLRMGGKITVAITPDMMSVYERSFPEAIVVPFTKEHNDLVRARGKFDYHCPLGDLLLYCFNDYKPREVKGYLKADPDLVKQARAKYEAFGPGPYIGMSWETLNPITNVIRNIPLNAWEPLLSIPGKQFISLQYGYLDETLEAFKQRTGCKVHTIMDVDPLKHREPFFAHIAALDAVVSVQNSNVHIAGSLGVDTMIMLSKSGEFRWRTEGDTCWWYPTVTINRQQTFRDWTPVIAKAAEWVRKIGIRH